MTPFTYQRAASVADAVAALAAGGPGAKILAGGQSLLLALKERQTRPSCLVAISRLADLRGTVLGPDGALIVGAANTYAALAGGDFPGWHAALAAVAGNLADRSVRNIGTIGGGVCQADPRYDMPTFLSAADAKFDLVSARGARVLAADDFFNPAGGTQIAPDEILARIILPPLATWDAVVFEKFRFRTFDAATGLVGGAVKFDLDGRIATMRLAVGAVAKAPMIPAAATDGLIGKSFAAVDIDSVAADVSHAVLPAPEGRQGKYLAELTISLVKRVLRGLAKGAGA